MRPVVPEHRPTRATSIPGRPSELINAINSLVITDGQKQPVGQFLGLTNPEGLFPRDEKSPAIGGA
jgi:hypothetical protein